MGCKGYKFWPEEQAIEASFCICKDMRVFFTLCLITQFSPLLSYVAELPQTLSSLGFLMEKGHLGGIDLFIYSQKKYLVCASAHLSGSWSAPFWLKFQPSPTAFWWFVIWMICPNQELCGKQIGPMMPQTRSDCAMEGNGKNEWANVGMGGAETSLKKEDLFFHFCAHKNVHGNLSGCSWTTSGGLIIH